jgi:hypothetical protein
MIASGTMSTSMIIFLSAVGCGVLFGALAVYEQARRMPWRQVGWKTPIWVFVGCVALGGFFYLIDSDVAEETLYEVVAEGPGAAVPATTEFPFVVEHPTAQHDLMVAPESSERITTPIRVQVRMTGPDGRSLIDEEPMLDVRCPSDEPCEWYTFSHELVPGRAGPHQLSVTMLSPGVTSVHVRVGDAEKTDGQRIPGY